MTARDVVAGWIRPYGNPHAAPRWVGGGIGGASPKKAVTLADTKAAQAERKTLYEQHAKLRTLRDQGKIGKEDVKRWEAWQSHRIDHLKEVEAGKTKLAEREPPPKVTNKGTGKPIETPKAPAPRVEPPAPVEPKVVSGHPQEKHGEAVWAAAERTMPFAELPRIGSLVTVQWNDKLLESGARVVGSQVINGVPHLKVDVRSATSVSGTETVSVPLHIVMPERTSAIRMGSANEAVRTGGLVVGANSVLQAAHGYEDMRQIRARANEAAREGKLTNAQAQLVGDQTAEIGRGFLAVVNGKKKEYVGGKLSPEAAAIVEGLNVHRGPLGKDLYDKIRAAEVQAAQVKSAPQVPKTRAVTDELAVSGGYGSRLAMRQEGFTPAATPREVMDRMHKAGMTSLDEKGVERYWLSKVPLAAQNDVLARVEHLSSLGVRLDRINAIEAEFAAKRYGAYQDGTRTISLDLAIKSRLEVNTWGTTQSVGGTFGHEVGHNVDYQLMNASSREKIDRIYARAKPTAERDISPYAANAERPRVEWFAEVFSKITSPGYVPGTVKYDQEFWSALREGGALRS